MTRHYRNNVSYVFSMQTQGMRLSRECGLKYQKIIVHKDLPPRPILTFKIGERRPPNKIIELTEVK